MEAMSNNNLETELFEQQLERMAKELGLSVDALQNMTAEERRAAREFKRYQDEYNARIKNAGNEIKNFGAQVGGIGKQALSGAGSFGTLNSAVDLSAKVLGGLASAIPVVGGAFKALGDAAADVTKLMIDQFQTGWNAYKDLQDIGLATSFDDMRKSASATGLLFQDVNKSLGKYSTDLANFGGSVGGGLKEFRKTAYELTDVRKQFNALGIGAAEFNEYQAKYMAQETRLGRARNQDLSKGTKEYIEQLDTLSKLTGLSRKDLQAQRDAALSETKFGAALSEMSKNTQESFQNLNSYISAKGGPELAQGLRDLTSGAVTSDAAKQLMMATGGKAAEVVDKMKSGMLSAEQGFEELRKSLNPKQMAEFAKYVGDSSIASKGFAQIQKMANSKSPTQADIDKIARQRNKNLEGQEEETRALANTEQQLYDTSRNLQLLMTSSTIVQKGMDTMSDALDELSVKMLTMAGATIPAELKARIEEKKAIRDATEAREKEKQLDEALREQQERTLELQEKINKETDPKVRRNLEKQLAASKREEDFLKGDQTQKAKEDARKVTEAAERRAAEATEKRKRVSGLSAKDLRQQQENDDYYKKVQETFDEKKFKEKDLENFEKYSKRKEELYNKEVKAIDANTKLTTEQREAQKSAAKSKASSQAKAEFAGQASAAGAAAKATSSSTRAIAAPADSMSGSASSGTADASDLISFAGGVTGDANAYAGLNPDVKDAFENMIEAYGKKVQVNSAFRSDETQQKMYAEWLAAGGSKKNPTVNTPTFGKLTTPVDGINNKSAHSSGRALDLQVSDFDALDRMGLLEKYKFSKVQGDPGHISYKISGRDGWEGTLEGPQSGYKPDVTMHGEEQLTIKNQGTVSKEAELMAKLIDRFDVMIEKHDAMIDLLDSGNDHSKKLVTALA
jgi:hypothetical protein